VEEALVREVKEKININVSGLKPVFVQSYS
jgi:ADP-ribose pyrophosphatase YjhB (NUDIX family)